MKTPKKTHRAIVSKDFVDEETEWMHLTPAQRILETTKSSLKRYQAPRHQRLAVIKIALDYIKNRAILVV